MSKLLFIRISAIIVLIGITSYVIAQDRPRDVSEENPSPYLDLLPESYRTIILSSDSIEWMLIDGWCLDDSLVSRLGEPFGEILCKLRSNDSVTNAQVKDLLLSPESFQNDSIVKECTYIPDFGILFISETDSLLVSYSLYCDICRFQTKNEYWDFDGTLIRSELLKLLREEFPSDKFVRNITRRL